MGTFFIRGKQIMARHLASFRMTNESLLFDLFVHVRLLDRCDVERGVHTRPSINSNYCAACNCHEMRETITYSGNIFIYSMSSRRKSYAYYDDIQNALWLFGWRAFRCKVDFWCRGMQAQGQTNTNNLMSSNCLIETRGVRQSFHSVICY